MKILILSTILLVTTGCTTVRTNDQEWNTISKEIINACPEEGIITTTIYNFPLIKQIACTYVNWNTKKLEH